MLLVEQNATLFNSIAPMNIFCNARLLYAAISPLLFGIAMMGTVHAGILPTHSLLEADALDALGASHVQLESNAAADTGLQVDLQTHVNGSARAFSRLDAGHLLGASSSGSYLSSSPFLTRGAGTSSARWRDIAFVSGEHQPAHITLHFKVEGSLRVPQHGAQATLSVSYQDHISDSFHRDVAEGGAVIQSGIFTSYGDDFFDAVELTGSFSGGDFVGLFSFDAPYDGTLGGYDWGVRLSTRSDATGALDGAPPYMAEVVSLNSLSLLQVTDPDGNPIAVTFDSGLILSSAVAVPEPDAHMSWLAGILVTVIAIYVGRHYSQSRQRGPLRVNF